MKKTIINLFFILSLIITLSNTLDQNLHYKSSTKEELTNNLEEKQKINDIEAKNAEQLIDNDNLSNYNLSVILNPDQHLVYGNFSLDYINTEDIIFNRIPFHLYINSMGYQYRKGQTTIENVIDTTENNNLDFKISETKHLLWIYLTKDLQPNERVNLVITFSTILPDGVDRANSFGINENQIITSVLFYPTPCVYDKGYWRIDPYLNLGDPFYMEIANYEFYIQAPPDIVVVANCELITQKLHAGKMHYNFKSDLPIRQIVFSAANFEKETIIYNNINVSCYFLPSSEYYWENDVLEYSISALSIFSELFYEYPYKILNIVEYYGFASGMEYPCQVNINKDLDQYFFEQIIVDIIAHQWWNVLVGINEIDEGFLDCGLCLWSKDYYLNEKYPDRRIFSPYGRTSTIRSYYDYTYGRSSKINQTLYEYIDFIGRVDYYHTAYTKPATILEYLRQKIGHQFFILALRHYIYENMFKIATLDSLQQAFEDIINDNLDSFFKPMFNNHYLPKYEFRNVNFDETTNKLSFIVIDINEKYHTYVYSQDMPIFVYNEENRFIVFNEVVKIEGNTTIELKLDSSEKPVLLKLYFGQNILFQDFSGNDNVSIKTTSIEFINSNPNYKIIPGFSTTSILCITFQLIAMKSKRKEN